MTQHTKSQPASTPLGFTRDDVRNLRMAADWEEDYEWDNGRRCTSPLRDLADRIEALLPPEKP